MTMAVMMTAVMMVHVFRQKGDGVIYSIPRIGSVR